VTHWHDFYLRLEKVIRDGEVKTRGTIFNKWIQILAYVDDITITGRSLEVVEETFISMEKCAKGMGITISRIKLNLWH
jgi:hypothetical protein